MVARLLSSKGIGSSFSMLRMPSMSPVLTVISCGAQFWTGIVHCFLWSKLTRVESPDIKGCFGALMSAMKCSWWSMFWKVLVCTSVVAKGGIVKFFVANNALDGAD